MKKESEENALSLIRHWAFGVGRSAFSSASFPPE
jgi:hypothetical protein